jgi:hypothetical protein
VLPVGSECVVFRKAMRFCKVSSVFLRCLFVLIRVLRIIVFFILRCLTFFCAAFPQYFPGISNSEESQRGLRGSGKGSVFSQRQRFFTKSRFFGFRPLLVVVTCWWFYAAFVFSYNFASEVSCAFNLSLAGNPSLSLIPTRINVLPRLAALLTIG